MKSARILSIFSVAFPVIFFGAFFLPCPSFAGLDLRLDLECASIIQFEELNATLQIKNITSRTLVISRGQSTDNAVVTFVIERKKNDVVKPVSNRLFVESLLIKANAQDEIKIDLSRWYNLFKTGRYIIYANVEWQGKKYNSNEMMVDVVRGLEILKKEYAVPGYDDKVRTFSLRYWRRKQSEFLFLRVDDDEENMNYGVFRLGVVIRFHKPTIKIDGYGYVTVIHQSGPDRFTRSGFKVGRDNIKYIGQCDQKQDGTPYPVLQKRVLQMKPPEKK
ncbi:MAG: hypothetical protein KAH23_05235 [Kiritimatiellae bacterium]|nr:hypothetical protein [Kiritimatiellia bacterium]